MVQVAARAEVKDTWLVEAPRIIAVDADGDRANRSLLQAGFQLPTSRTGASSSGAEKGFVLRAHGPLTRVRRPEFIQREGGVLVNPKLRLPLLLGCVCFSVLQHESVERCRREAGRCERHSVTCDDVDYVSVDV